ncbi:MAG: hypothetical protein AVDCRST_MAG25-1728, partial [uncultured Rubrobacteraceae bacterium]
GASVFEGPASAGDHEPGAVGGEEWGGARHDLEARNWPAKGVSDHHPQARRRPRHRAPDAGRRRRVPGVRAAPGGRARGDRGEQEDRVL